MKTDLGLSEQYQAWACLHHQVYLVCSEAQTAALGVDTSDNSSKSCRQD